MTADIDDERGDVLVVEREHVQEVTSQFVMQVNGGPILGLAEVSNGVRLVIGL